MIAKTKHIREFDCVTIRSWMDGKRLQGTHWTCYDCHYPPCAFAFCSQRPMHAAVHNSWVSEEEYYKQAKPPLEAAKDAFAVQKKRWFCLACRYPPCASQSSSDCSKTRVRKREHRFQTWTCTQCHDDDCLYPRCGFCEQRATRAPEQKSWVSDKDYYKQVKPPSEAAKKAFAVKTKR